MKGLRVTGAIGAYYLAAVFILSLILYLVAIPAIGLSVADLSDPIKIITTYGSSVTLHLIAWLNFLFGVGFILVVTELYVRLREADRGIFTVAAIFGLIGSVMAMVSSGIMVYGLPNLSQSITTFPADVTGAYRALYALSNGIGAFSFLSIGIWES